MFSSMYASRRQSGTVEKQAFLNIHCLECSRKPTLWARGGINSFVPAFWPVQLQLNPQIGSKYLNRCQACRLM